MDDAMAIEFAIRAREQLSGMDETIRKGRQMSNSLRGDFKSIIRQAQKMKTRWAAITRTFMRQAQKVIAVVKAMKAAIMKLRNAFRTLRNQALKAFAAMIALTAIPIKFFADFEQKMANVNTLLDVSKQKFEEMGQGVIEISNRIGESATKLSTALYDIVSAGVDASNSLAVLDQSSRAAKAGMTDTQTAVNAGLATINAYNLAISDLSHVYDLQFMTVKKGVLTYSELAHAQGQLLPSSKKLNESLENMYGAFSFVTKAGLNAQRASMSLARAYDSLVKKSKQLAEAGVEVYDEFGKFRGILPVMEDLADQLKGLTDKEMQGILQNIGFDIRAARALIPMITNVEGLRESIEAMGDSAGAMEEAFDKATNTIAFRFNRAKENVVNAVREMGSGWREEVNTMFDDIAAWAGAIKEFVKDNKDAIKSLLLFGLKLTGLVALIGAVGTAIFTLMTPIGMVTAGIFMLASAWYLNLWDIRGKTEDMWSIVKPIFSSMWNWTVKAWKWAIETAGDAWDWLTNTTWKQKWDDIKEWMSKGWNWMINLVGDAWDWLDEKAPWLTDTLETTWEWAVKAKNELFNWIKETAVPWIDNTLKTTWEWTIKGFDWFKDLLRGKGNLTERISKSFNIDNNTDLKETIGLLEKYGNMLGFSTEQLAALAKIESDFKNVENTKSTAVGPLQITQTAINDLKESGKVINNSLDTLEGRVEAAVKYLALLRDKYKLTGEELIGAYYAGIGNIEKYGISDKVIEGQISPKEYVKRFIEAFEIINNESGLSELQTNASMIINASIKITGQVYESLKTGFQTGNWSEVFDIGVETWKKGMGILVSLKLIKGAATALIQNITGALSASKLIALASTVKDLAVPGAIGVISIAIQLKEAMDKGDYKDFAANMVVALIAGLTAAGLSGGNIQAGILTFTVALNFEIGEKIRNLFSGLRAPEPIELSPLGLPKVMYDYFKDNYATGGYISGLGTPTSDSIPAMLSDGEYVINAQATRKWLPILEAINSGNVPGFRMGGGMTSSPYQYVDPEAINYWSLQSAGLGDNRVLQYLAKVAKDTTNFQYIVDLISGIGDMKEKYEKLLEALQVRIDELKEEIMDQLDDLAQPADTERSWNKFIPILSGLLDGFQDTMSESAFELVSGITSGLEKFTEVEGGISGAWGEITGAWGKLTSGDIKGALGMLSEGTVQGISSIFSGIKNSIVAGVQEAANRAAEKFQQAIEKFNEAIARFEESISMRGSLQAANFDYSDAISQAKNTAKDYANQLAEERRAAATKQGAAGGSLLGGIIGFIVGGPAGAAIGAGIGGAGGAVVGALGDYYKSSDYQKKLKKLMEEVKEKINETLESAFKLDTGAITANIDQAIMDSINSGKNLAMEIGKSLYGQVKKSLQSVFLWAQNNVINQYLKPVIDNIKEKITNSITSGENINFNNLIDIDKLITAAQKAEQLGQRFANYTADLKQQMIDAGIGKDIINAIFPSTIKYVEEIKDALSSAMAEALDTGEYVDFTKTMGESIYENAKEGLIQAFMESKVYQEMFAEWFDVASIQFTGNLQHDFGVIQNVLNGLKDELRLAGLDFNYTELAAAGEGNGTIETDNYYAGADTSGESGTVINNEYNFAPHDNMFIGSDKEDLFREFLKWKDDMEDDSV